MEIIYEIIIRIIRNENTLQENFQTIKKGGIAEVIWTFQHTSEECKRNITFKKAIKQYKIRYKNARKDYVGYTLNKRKIIITYVVRKIYGKIWNQGIPHCTNE